ncbi:Aldolase-type TIM barrel [Penicillium cf. griseofulvum]|uniref:L-lactate dehydrogenase (cytochrome) n=1 Tax=Penicillium cf. griseofulvum TaxID=2972120 RepID=A0A9W9MZM4_9EURO|nr:Aldolase-type TIM barrel [Penicillium cf. griseofulvum]KAJ5421823.1 Aldolase-type TIM barrel [Penicillium cf. griseofulvum]KAJ5428014.1 Aldolase-type TIM barrel [Penicillium cf. griseofulvum]
MVADHLLSVQEVSRHCEADDCWIVVGNKVWDCTHFARVHPGGADVILQFAGHDATHLFYQAHSDGLIESTLPSSKHVGDLDPNSIDDAWRQRSSSSSLEPTLRAPEFLKPPLSSILSSHDFERVARETFSRKAWAFYSSAANDLISKEANQSFYNRIWFRPRLMRDVTNVDTRCQFQGVETASPIMVAPAAMAKLAHEAGEKGIARAAAARNIIQCIATTASYSLEDIVLAAPRANLFFQLYVHRDRSVTELLLKRVWEAGIRAIMVTIDAPIPGKREADERVRTEQVISMPMTGTVARNDKLGSGLTKTTGGFIDSSLCWGDLPWLKKVWKGKVILKGIQCVEDAQTAAQLGVQGIVLSNHGGRNLDTSPPALLTLLELSYYDSAIFQQTEVYIDGGITRGTDILKALCLGAKGVLIGRPFLYALNYGEEGIVHLIDILQSELETAMRLVGITNASQAHPGLLNTKDIDHLAIARNPNARREIKL